MLVAISGTYVGVRASDHDDGEIDLKGRALNLTDLYAFREDNQTGRIDDKGNLVLVMNTNPNSLPRQQYFFSTEATYDFHIARVKANHKNTAPTGNDNIMLRFQFGEPNEKMTQPVSVTSYRDNVNVDGGKGLIALNGTALSEASDAEGMMELNGFRTTSLAESDAKNLKINQAHFGADKLTFFAGLREDPFFFDVDSFFRVRAAAAGFGPPASFKSPSKAEDFTSDRNINTIVVKIPLEFLQTSDKEPIFDIWTTISIANGTRQIERVARPAINEGLIITNDYLNAFNMIPPSSDLTSAAAPVLAEATKTLLAFRKLGGNIGPTPAQVVAAFLPDEMRIDTRVTIPVAKTAYNADTSGSLGILTGGRKLEDDVMDITLSFLVAGDATGMAVKDNVSYEGVAGNPAQPGHKFLYGQTTRHGEAQFPFLAQPN